MQVFPPRACRLPGNSARSDTPPTIGRDYRKHGREGQGQSHGRGNGRDVDRSRVEIPAEAEARQWRAFREDVLKVMREGRYPEEYEREVERYYERLIR